MTNWKSWWWPVVRLVIVGVLLAWLYGWLGPRMYPQNKRFGFGYGMMHGAMMPMALPALVGGQNVEIFAPENDGRTYKLGYIVGINLCGLVVFGSAFWSPKRRRKSSPANREPQTEPTPEALPKS